jgi:hypothetical protein
VSLEDNLIVATRAAPHLDPATLYGVASTTPDDQVDVAAKAVGGFASASQLRAYVERNPATVQVSIWSRLSAAEQKMLTGAGYKPPAMADPDHLEAQAAAEQASQPHQGPIGTVLHALGAPLRAVKHAYRAAASITDELRGQGYSGFGAEAFKRSFTPSEWADAWDRTQGEEDTFSPLGIKALQGDPDTLAQLPDDVRSGLPKLDDEGVRLAKLVSANRANPQAGIDQAVEGVPDEDKARIVDRMGKDPDVAKAAVFLDGQKYSLGRRLAHTVGLDPTKSGKAWTVVSGTTDAIASWYGDPTISGLEAAKGLNQVRYLVRDASDVERLITRPSVARHLEDVAAYLADGRFGALVERYPAYAGVVEHLADEGVTTAEGLGKWFQTSQGLTALLDGTVSGVAKAAPLMPHVGEVGLLKLDLKVATKHAIDFAADMPKSGLGRLVVSAGKLARRFTTLIPKGLEFDASSPEAVTAVQRMAATALPAARVRDLVDAWVGASGDLGARFGIYKGLLSEVFRAAGVDSTVEGRQFVANFLGKLEDGVAKRAYSVGDIDQVLTGGKQVAAGILEGQLTSQWSMPSYKVLWAQSKRLSLMRGLYKVSGIDLTEKADRFMQAAWKPTTLLRLGFPVRAGGEELVGAVMREGLVPILRGGLAAGVAKAAERESIEGVARILPWNPLRGVWNRMSEYLPEGVTDPAEAAAQYIGGRTAHAFRYVEGKLAGRDYVQGAQELWDHGVMQTSFADEISAAHTPGGGYLADPDTAARMTRDGSKMRPIYFSRTGAYREYAPTEGLYNQAWQDSLGEIATSKLARPALEHAADGREAQVQAVYDTIKAPASSSLREKALRATQTRDGRIVGETATEEEALRDWASAVVDHVNAHLQGPSGEMVYPELAGDLLSTHQAPTMRRLEAVPTDARPTAVKGAEVVPIPASPFKKMVDKGFTEVVGRPMDWMVRQPLFVHNYVLAKREVEGLRSLLMDQAEREVLAKVEVAAGKAGDRAFEEALKLPQPETMTDAAHQVRAEMARRLAVKEVRGASDIAALGDRVDAQLRDVAVERAVNKTVPYIHDPEIRSQMAVIARNVAPFWFAQEQFYKRWAKVLSHSPEAFRQAQLVMMGLRHSGFLKQDENGDDYFLYPAVSVVQDVLTRGMELVTGERAKLPLPVGFSGHVKFATPGLERLGLPSFGPFVAVGMHALRSRFPELEALEEKTLGERGAGRPYWEQVTPTSVARIWHVLADNPETSAQMGSAMMQAMAYLEASGNGLPDQATTAEKEAFIDRTKNWARILLLNRAIYGYSAPAAPELQLDPNDLHKEYRDLLRTLPIEEATKEFIARHPDATAYTVFQSQAKAGVPLPATEGTFAFMDANRDFLNSYHQAGGLFLPQASKDGAYSQLAYREQLATAMRERKTPQEFLDDVLYASAADEYFTSRDAKEAALQKYKGTPRAARIRQTWAQWKEGFMAAHPTFEMMLAESGANATKKQQTLDEARLALSDPRVPKNTQTDQMRELLAAYDNHLAFQQRFSGQNSQIASIRKKAESKSFASWADDYVKTNPDVKAMYDRLMREEVD